MAAVRELVLVGAGHAHVQVLRRLAMRPIAGARVTLVVDRPEAVYSGMVPGLVAGQYRAHELEIDARPLARRAGASIVVASATGLDPSARRIALAGRAPIAYDVASFDVGSEGAGLDLPGVREHALATRPIGRFVGAIDALVARAAAHAGPFRVIVVGAGAAGIELALALRTRLAVRAHVELVDGAEHVLGTAAARIAARARRALERRGVSLRLGVGVASAEAGAVWLRDGERIACDALVWAAGAAAPPLFRASGIATDERGFARVRPTLQLVDCDDVFAAGDCARFEPDLAKAGVYAVRQGPVLDHNLRAQLGGGSLRGYHPQRDALMLLNLGDGSALGAKWGCSFEGPRVFALKDFIDRRFVRRFQVLDAAGTPTRALPAMLASTQMRCGGCAAKLGESPLARALARLGAPHDERVEMGLASPDDAAAVRTRGGERVVASIDGLRPFTDDPWLVGNVAAVNAASDLHAKGAAPRFALANVSIPEDDPVRSEELLHQVLAGARAALDAEGITLVGGHTTSGAELVVGLAVFGDAPDALLRLGGLAPGDALILTKPLGTGVLFRADALGRARGAWIEAAVASMRRSNARAAAVARASGASACTDVSGFGLAGHLGAMLRASGVSARIVLGAIPLLPGVRELLAAGVRSTAHPENAKARAALRIAADAAAQPQLDVLFDPQTSGGLLFGVARERADETLARLREAGDGTAAVIGCALARSADGTSIEIAASD